MSKLAYNKLGLNKMINKEPIIINFNEQQIEVAQYLPIEKKLDLISDIINKSIDENNYYNPCRIEIFTTVEIILAYTNLTVTDKQKEDLFKLYDSFVASGFSEKVMSSIPESDITFINYSVRRTIKNIYNQKNSVLGILETISTDYNTLNLDASEIQSKLADPENLDLLRAVLTKLG